MTKCESLLFRPARESGDTGLAFLLALMVAVSLTAGCGGETDTEAAEPERDAEEQTAPVAAGDQEQEVGDPVPDVGYAIRDFEPVGSGTLTVGDTTYSFQVAECHLQDRELSNGRIQDVYVLGAGEIDGRPFFVELKRSRDERDRRHSAGLTLHFAPLPEVYGHEMPTSNEVLTMMERVQTVDSLRSMGVGALTPDGLTVSGGSITTTDPVAFMSFVGGGLDGPVGEGALSVECTL